MPASMSDTLLFVTMHVSPSASSRPVARWTGRVAALAAAPALAVLAVPARADVPAGWGGETEHNTPDALHALGVYLGAPLLLVVLIALAVYLPAMVRGEKLLPDHSGGEPQWIGGPRQGVAEL